MLAAAVASREEEWLYGWDETPGIVSVWAEADGRTLVWRRDPKTHLLQRETAKFQPWLLVPSLVDLRHLRAKLAPHQTHGLDTPFSYQELEGDGLRYLVRGPDMQRLRAALLHGAAQRLGRAVQHASELGADAWLELPPEEQYLVATGRVYFRGLGFDDVRRLQLDLETTGLDPDIDRIFMVALRGPHGEHELIEAAADTDAAEAELLHDLARSVEAFDPDVIENHNLHGFDLPFLMRRAERLGVRLALGRHADADFRLRPAARGARLGQAGARSLERLQRARYTLPGRELIDSLDAVRRHDFSARDLPGHGLKAVARHLGLAAPDREYIAGSQVHETYRSDPERVRRYALGDVDEAAGVARVLGGAAFSLSQMAPRRYERSSDAGAATGVLDPLLLRAYLRAGRALPAHGASDGTPHQGAALHLFASGVAERIVKADVASLYPSLMRQYRIGPRRDVLGVFLTIIDQLVERRLRAKAAARLAPPGSLERFQLEALSAAIKLVVNSGYGYLGAVGLTRFADVHAANDVTRRGRELLAEMCRELERRGVQLLEADTDGVYFSVPDSFSEADERRVVAEVAARLPPLVELQFDGRYAAMLSHEPKNYALKPYAGPLLLRGVAFRSSRAEPFGEAFLRRALEHLLRGDLLGVRAAFVETVLALRKRQICTIDVCSRVRLTKTPAQYAAVRETRQELAYEALLAHGHEHWRVGERILVYRRTLGRPGLWEAAADAEDEAALAFEAAPPASDERDYDTEHYVRQLRLSFASRLERGVTPEDFQAIVADPDRPPLFSHSLDQARPILTVIGASERD
jgi:DNA polymerase I